jgi:uncharacterized membrane protein
MYQKSSTKKLPYASTVLTLGIISCFGMFCFGIVGLIMGIIAIIFYRIDKNRYQKDPLNYSNESFKMLNSGRVLAIIGLVLSSLFVFLILIAIISENQQAILDFPWNLLR